jgi:hypothetical protein
VKVEAELASERRGADALHAARQLLEGRLAAVPELTARLSIAESAATGAETMKAVLQALREKMQRLEVR